MAITLQEQLNNVQKAIADAETAIEYRTSGRLVRRSELPALYAREKDLLARIASQSGDNRTYCQWDRS
ncbi:hypothetical protein [Pelosinus sp. UFO1]|uniref:hypothetical protein n=1 Tax=Pelosinus sp. UFO1 TaxID=484770 RepID=UPI0004D162D8|nr:hypothetical protein [Pelosinus sp. UFO1]AIF52010.1 hypothetical protein UFO1_2463 [Pelosinus sp. UFO1]